MHIPVKIEIGCMVLVVLPFKKSNTYVNTIEKWYIVTNVFINSIKVKELDVKIPLYAIEYFTFGGVGIPNPEFDLERLLNDYQEIK